MNPRQHQALALLNAGLSIVPIRPDGTKAATVRWEPLQHAPASMGEVMRWFRSMHSGIGIIGGAVSGGLEILDFDAGDVFEPWRNLVDQIYPGLPSILPVVLTPSGGYHAYYRAHEIQGNQKLARRIEPGKPIEVKIETRGEGGYVLSPWCHGDCHPSKQCYELMQGDLLKIPLISQQARDVLLNSARAFEESIETTRRKTRRVSGHDSDRPGDVFEAHHTWEDILLPHGWTKTGERGDTTYWRRPGKDGHGVSATTNHDGHDCFYVFSSNAWPFQERRGYRRFTVFCLLNYGGDFHAAAKAAMREG